MTRKQALNVIRVDAAHTGNMKYGLGVYIENRVSYESFLQEVKLGYAIHRNMCKEPDCKEPAHYTCTKQRIPSEAA